MLIYEKDNKLNINFENSVTENPDLQIGKSGDKTQILVDGQESGGGSEPLVVTFTDANPASCDKTWAEIKEAYDSGREIVAYCEHEESSRKWRIQLSVFFTSDSGEVGSMEGVFYYIGSGNYKFSADCRINDHSVDASTLGFTTD